MTPHFSVHDIDTLVSRIDKLCEDFESLVDVLVERGVVMEDDLTDAEFGVDEEETSNLIEDLEEVLEKEIKSFPESKRCG